MSPLDQFLLDCYYKLCYKGRKFGVSTPRYAKSTVPAGNTVQLHLGFVVSARGYYCTVTCHKGVSQEMLT
jgi:hypothetical protein